MWRLKIITNTRTEWNIELDYTGVIPMSLSLRTVFYRGLRKIRKNVGCFGGRVVNVWQYIKYANITFKIY